MTITEPIMLFVACICWWGVIRGLDAFLDDTENPVLRVLSVVYKLLAIPLISLGTMAFNSIVWWELAGILVAAYAVLVPVLLSDCPAPILVGILDRGQDPNRRNMMVFVTKTIISAVLTIGFVVYGAWNMQTFTGVRHEYHSSELERGYTFVFMSDSHAGTAQPLSVLEQFVDEVNAESVDFVILGGDITDEYTSGAEMRETYRILSRLEAPTYFVYGNHDRQPDSAFVGGRTYTDDELVAAIEGAGITILVDETVRIGPDLALLGREDLSRSSARVPFDGLELPEDGFLLVADHQPYDRDELDAGNGDLQVSGHTHAGQLAPNRIIYSMLGLPVLGDYDFGDLHLLVSAGEAGWSFPFRTESHSSYEIVTISPED